MWVQALQQLPAACAPCLCTPQLERARRLASQYAAAALQSRPKLRLHLELDAPKVAIPAADGNGRATLALDFGRFVIETGESGVGCVEMLLKCRGNSAEAAAVVAAAAAVVCRLAQSPPYDATPPRLNSAPAIAQTPPPPRACPPRRRRCMSACACGWLTWPPMWLTVTLIGSRPLAAPRAAP